MGFKFVERRVATVFDFDHNDCWRNYYSETLLELQTSGHWSFPAKLLGTSMEALGTQFLMQ